MKHLYIVALISLLSYTGRSQDHLYSQFLNSPLYLNPALSGTAENDLRFGVNYRRQWMSVPSGMQYYSAFADKYTSFLEGGVGALVTGSQEGYLQKRNVALMYAPHFYLNDVFLSVGFEGGYSTRSVNWNKLYFADMLDEQGVINGARSQADLPVNTSGFLDVGVGAVTIYRNFLLGASVKHANKPDESLTGNLTSVLPRRLIIHSSYIFETNVHDENSARVIPSAVFYNQGRFRSMSGGVEYKNNYMNLGLWYRNNMGIRKNDAVVVSVTFDSFLSGEARDKKLRIGVSHDATTSGLGYTRTSGSTEGAIIYEVLTKYELAEEYRGANKKGGFIPCYKF